MKLVNRLNIAFFISSLAILVLMGAALIIVLNFTFDQQVEEKLEHTFRSIKTQLNGGASVNSLPPYLDITIVDFEKDTLYFNEITVQSPDEEEGEVFIQLHAIVNIDRNTYKIVISESRMETDDFFETIITIVLVSIVLMLISLFLANRKISKTIWGSFYENLNKVKAFSIHNQQSLQFRKTNITEFEELNAVLEKLANRATADYDSLKQFSENASHELQTPLAIMRSKLEALIDSDELKPSHIEKIKTIYDTTNRLTRISKDLLLLTKLENRQFENVELISINRLIEQKVNEWQEIIDLKQLQIILNFESIIEVEIHPNLADILLSNLLSNAIQHNVPQGVIEIIVKGKSLAFLNTANKPLQNPESVFHRFYKEEHSQQSIGLGLAIVKRICDIYQFKIDYSFLNKMHVFSVHF